MCTIAGYIGNQAAAPILFEMLSRQEGLVGGFYTGIATLHEGRLYYEKVVGDSGVLLKETQALQLPGTIGIIHTRTASGGGREWAHPFIDAKEELAYIANGSVGKYENDSCLAAAAIELEKAGCCLKSAQLTPVDTYPSLADGRYVHFSDIMCQTIAEAYFSLADESNRLRRAATKAYERYPGELVGLCLHARHPDEIVAVRHNKPIEIGFDHKGNVFMASTRLAFPENIVWQMRLPAMTGASVRRDASVELDSFTGKLLRVGPYPSSVAIVRELIGFMEKHGPCNIEQLFAAVIPLWPDGTLVEKETVVFDLLASLFREGRLEFDIRRRPGMEGRGTVPWTWVMLKEASGKNSNQ